MSKLQKLECLLCSDEIDRKILKEWKFLAKNVEYTKMFPALASKYLNVEFEDLEGKKKVKGSGKKDSTSTSTGSLLCCEKCYKSVESFCLLYGQISRLTVQLNKHVGQISTKVSIAKVSDENNGRIYLPCTTRQDIKKIQFRQQLSTSLAEKGMYESPVCTGKCGEEKIVHKNCAKAKSEEVPVKKQKLIAKLYSKRVTNEKEKVSASEPSSSSRLNKDKNEKKMETPDANVQRKFSKGRFPSEMDLKTHQAIKKEYPPHPRRGVSQELLDRTTSNSGRQRQAVGYTPGKQMNPRPAITQAVSRETHTKEESVAVTAVVRLTHRRENSGEDETMDEDELLSI